MSRDINVEFFAFESSMRSVNKIFENVVLTINWRTTSFYWSVIELDCQLISALFCNCSVIVILLSAKWASTTLKAWLCFAFWTSYNQIWMSLFSLTMMKNEHFICLLSSCRFWFLATCVFRFLSQIIHVLLVISSLNFFVRFKITA
jgi:hypothetical protein